MKKYGSKHLKKTKARVAHQCNYCEQIISPEEYYFRETAQGKFLQSLHARVFCSVCNEQYGETLLKMKTDTRSKSITRGLSSYFDPAG